MGVFASSCLRVPSKHGANLLWTAYATGVSKSTVARRRLPFTATAVGTRKLAFRWGVEVVGWPEGVDFDSPGALPAKHLCRLTAMIAQGAIYFRRLGREELEAAAAQNGASTVHVCTSGHRAWREDKQGGAQVHRPDRQSKRAARRRPLVPKTRATVDEVD